MDLGTVAKNIEAMDEKQRKSNIVVAPVNTDRYSHIIGIEWSSNSMPGSEGLSPYLVVDP